jgi:uncharacterized protein (DUF2147 family)
MMRLVPCLLLAAFVAACEAAPPTAATLSHSPMQGRWLTQSGNLEIEIAPCGQALCGTAVRVLNNVSMAEPGKTMTGPSPLGLKILSDFRPSNEGMWEGRIYNRETDKTYDCLISLAAPDQLRLRPYVGLPLFGQTQIWQRVAASTSEK